MRVAASLSEHPVGAVAVGETAGDVLERLGPAPDVVAVFVTPPHAGALEDITGALATLLQPSVLVGAAAAGVAGGARLVEGAPAVALWAARLDGSARAVRVPAGADGLGGEVTPPPGGATLVLLADPFSVAIEDLLAGTARDHPATTVVGGLASAGRGPGGNRLVLDGRVLTDGAVGVLVEGLGQPEALVAQGCRPVGPPLTVTGAERGVVYELAGRPALERLLTIVGQLSPADHALAARGGLHLGIVVDEHRLDFTTGDFVVRGVLGADRAAGAIAIGGEVPVGATVQLQVLDAATAGDDLQRVLAGHPAQGALLFTCTGRGSQLFGAAHHDAAMLNEQAGPPAVAGMTCAGELGPMAGTNHLHTFSACMALFG